MRGSGENRRRKLLFVFGTRPEAIKLAPLIRRCASDGAFEVRTCVTAQHREMLDEALGSFGLHPDSDLGVMRPNQDLPSLTAALLTALDPLLRRERPDFVVVQGDTTSTFAASLAAFYAHLKVAHVEAGLRSGDLEAPWPEEMNRRLTAALATLHFAPNERAEANLLREGIPASSIHVTGNTVIDALLEMRDRIHRDAGLAGALAGRFEFLDRSRRLLLVTLHRRESFGGGLESVCRALVRIVRDHPDVEVVYPVHYNPNVREAVDRVLRSESSLASRIHLIEPVDYPAAVYLMERSTLIVTDSGGIQEEAPSLGKPLLVTRETTERPEAVAAGSAMLVGTGEEAIVEAAAMLLSDRARYEAMARVRHVYGDGHASERIAGVLLQAAG